MTKAKKKSSAASEVRKLRAELRGDPNFVAIQVEADGDLRTVLFWRGAPEAKQLITRYCLAAHSWLDWTGNGFGDIVIPGVRMTHMRIRGDRARLEDPRVSNLAAMARDLAAFVTDMEWAGVDGYPMCPECDAFEKGGVHVSKHGRLCSLGAMCDRIRAAMQVGGT